MGRQIRAVLRLVFVGSYRSLRERKRELKSTRLTKQGSQTYQSVLKNPWLGNCYTWTSRAHNSLETQPGIPASMPDKSVALSNAVSWYESRNYVLVNLLSRCTSDLLRLWLRLQLLCCGNVGCLSVENNFWLLEITPGVWGTIRIHTIVSLGWICYWSDGIELENGRVWWFLESSLTFIDQHQTEIISRGVFFIDFAKCRGQVESSEE